MKLEESPARPPANPAYTRDDFVHSPLLVFYEITRACHLLCRHCRARAQRHRHPQELTTQQARRLVDELTRFPKPPLLVFTGGDPIMRGDIFHLVRYAAQAGLSVAMSPSATPLVSFQAVYRLKEAGLHRLAVSLDGADAITHDGFRRVPRSFQRTLEIIADARRCGLPVQINTTIASHNVQQVDAMADLLAGLDIALWSVFFLIPTGRARPQQRISAAECEAVFQKLFAHAQHQPYAIKTTEAPHYRRFMLQQARGAATPAAGGPARVGPLVGTNDGKGVMFVSHVGEIYPSGFLPICCGCFPLDSLVRVYQESELFKSLRDPSRLGGKCGRCEYRDVCGGSRARAYALTGDPLAAEPDCAFVGGGN
jgi:radical SAM protein